MTSSTSGLAVPDHQFLLLSGSLNWLICFGHVQLTWSFLISWKQTRFGCPSPETQQSPSNTMRH